MKRIIAIVLALVFVASLGACKSSKLTTEQNGVETVNELPTVITSNFVVTFSTTGHTFNVAQYISNTLQADSMHLKAEQEYSKEDTDISNENCRAKQESEDPNCRPSILAPVEYSADYTNIFIGFPIWYDKAPRVIYSFMDSFDFTGKNVYLFCTSEESSIDNALNDLKTTYPNVNIIAGERFAQNATQEEVNAWLAELGVTA